MRLFVVVQEKQTSVKYKENGIELRRNYNISDKNVFLAEFKNKK